ncbi:MAG: flagellin [Selenomonadaceae bacterium]|nr:flagellin [Selenomonadaceae bacterium]
MMPMVVKNNLSANNTLNTLNANNSALAKSLKKVSSGMRITGAGDDSSGYAIGKKMEVMVRALGQDVQNVKTGNNLIAVAEGGIQSVLDNLRTMKEMLLNSMNDHNSDQDRDTLNKEYSKRMETITDIAAETDYNGRRLLNGQYYSPKSMRYEAPVELPLEEDKYGNLLPVYNVEYTNDPVTSVWKYKTANPAGSVYTTSTSSASSTAGTSGTSGSIIQNTISDLATNFSGRNYTTAGPGFAHTAVGIEAKTSYSGGIGVYVDFSAANVNGTAASYPSDFDQQGFSILCGACYQFINIRFDANLATSASTYNPAYSTKNSQAREYTIGIQGVTNESDLEAALFDGIAASHTNYATANGSRPNTLRSDSATVVSIDERHNVNLVKETDSQGNPTGKYYISKDSSPILGINDDGTYDKNTPPWALPPDPEPEAASDEEDEPGNPLIIHHGPKQNQYLPVYINSMHPRALKIEGTATTPRELAALSLGYVNFAIEYSLNEATRMGAYRSRLGFTEDNLVIDQENTQSAESTMQDADMAKEMMTYTKNNVLSQTAQSMLSQANQNVGGVLDLLQ